MSTHITVIDDYHRALQEPLAAHLFPAGPAYSEPEDEEVAETKVVRKKPEPKPKANEDVETK